jgi:hypothetical protein
MSQGYYCQRTCTLLKTRYLRRSPCRLIWSFDPLLKVVAAYTLLFLAVCCLDFFLPFGICSKPAKECTLSYGLAFRFSRKFFEMSS